MGSVKLQIAIAAIVFVVDLWAFWPPPSCNDRNPPKPVYITAGWLVAGCPERGRP